MATSLFTNISDQLIRGSIRIKVLNHILAKKNTFTELVKIGNCTKCMKSCYLNLNSHYFILLFYILINNYFAYVTVVIVKIDIFLIFLKIRNNTRPVIDLFDLLFPQQIVFVKMRNAKMPMP